MLRFGSNENDGVTFIYRVRPYRIEMIDKDLIIRQLAEQGRRRIAVLATELARARSQDKEVILAELKIERDLLDCCRLCYPVK